MPINEAFRGRGQLFIRCVECSSTGTCHAKTEWLGEKVKQEFLVDCPWCEKPMNIRVQTLPEDSLYPSWSA